MCGAAILAAKAAIQTGIGLITLLCYSDILPILQTAVPAATCKCLPDHADSDVVRAMVESELSNVNAAVIGCGIGQSKSNIPILEAFRSAACPVVWDADALNLLSTHSVLTLNSNAMITPHPAEAARLLKTTTSDVVRNPEATLDELYSITHAGVILKGARSLITDGTHRALNPTGSPAMARGGSGDILSGILGALTARFHNSFSLIDIMQTACFIHGQAGEKAANLYGENSSDPQSIISCINI